MIMGNSPKKTTKNFFNKIIGYFLRGLLLTIPFWLTIYIISLALATIDSIIMVKIPGLGIAIILLTITIVGYVGSTFIMKSTLEGVEKFTLKIPLVNIIYSSFKEMTTAVVGNKKKFNSPVFMLMSKEPFVMKIGFITQKDMKDMNLKNSVAVYIPGAYTLSGDLYIVEKKDLIPINASSTEVMKFAVSAGITSLSKTKKENLTEKDNQDKK